MSIKISVNIQNHILEKVDAIAQEKGITRSEALHDLLTKGIYHYWTQEYGEGGKK